MGAFFIELLAEVIEASLLAPQRGGRRPRGLLLERLVHPLVPAILLGVSGLDQFGIDAQPNPPDREATESSDGSGGERQSGIRRRRAR